LEKVALTRSDAGGTAADSDIGQLVDDLWLAQAEIDLAARSEPLRDATYRYAFRLAEAARGEIADASALRGPQVQFMDAAYGDMWPDLPPQGPRPRRARFRPHVDLKYLNSL
jgi:hypothetical protein